MFEAATTARVGRKMEFPDRITLPLAHGVLARIDAALIEDEPRLELIREAIERELARRERITRNPASQRDSTKSRDAE